VNGLLAFVEWLGVIAGGFAVAAALLVGALAWLLNRPIDDGPDAGR